MSEGSDRSGVLRRAMLSGLVAGGMSTLLACEGRRAGAKASARVAATGGYRGGGSGTPGVALDESARSYRRPAPECVAPVTTKDIEGPFFKAGAPLGNPLDLGQGVPFVLAGSVTDAGCRPLSNATIEVWQADAVGRYDSAGFAYRTTLITNESGTFQVRSILPGHYKNGAQFRPAHVHVKVHHVAHRPLTTQLYFVGDPYNDIDPWFDPSRALTLSAKDEVKTARFDFVLG